MSDTPVHIVCTYSEAGLLIESHRQFFVSNCGCREDNGPCRQSRPDICLSFYIGTEASGSGKREITQAEAMKLLQEARQKRLVPRPFRDNDRMYTEGICFCCSDCCWYFRNREEACDKGRMIEMTDCGECAHCSICSDSCPFGARSRKDGSLSVDRNACYGCGLCTEDCPNNCITMIQRED